MGFHQDESLLYKFMELVDCGERIDADYAEELVDTRSKLGRSDRHLFHR